MKRELSFVQMGLSVISIVTWFLLPVLSFVIIIPLFNISGWNLALHINQLMLFVLLGGILMLIAALVNNRKMMIVAGALEIIIVILSFIFRKQVLLGGNFKWIYNSATLLVSKVPEVVGVDTSSWDIQQIIKYVVENFLQPGIGGIIHGICTLAYLIIAICASKEKPIIGTKNTNGTGTNSKSSSTFNTNTTHQRTGYSHRT